MSCDKLVFDLSQEIEGSPNVFVKKDWLNILDNMKLNYSSNQSVIDTSQLANSNKFLSYREAYLLISMVLSIATDANTANFTPASTATSADYCMGLKNWFGQIIHSFTLDYNGTTILQQTPYINMWNIFKLMTSLSWADVITQGSAIGFYPDDPLSFGYYTPATSTCYDGVGVCNNGVASTAGQAVNANYNNLFNIYAYTRGNIGLVKRIQYINFDGNAAPNSDASTTYGSLLNGGVAANGTSTACNLLWKSYIYNKVNGSAGARGILQIAVSATVYLKHIHSFFAMCPLLKGVFMKMTMNLNNTSVNFTVAPAGAGQITLNSVSNAVGGVCPLHIASISQGAQSLGVGTYSANLSVGAKCLNTTITGVAGYVDAPLAKSIYLYVPAYTFNPIFEQAYLSSPVKQIKYTDVYQYQVQNVQAGGYFNNLLTNGIANIKSVLIVPLYSASAGSANTGLPAGIPVYQSPYDIAGTGGTSPLCHITNFNCVVSGQNTIYNTQRYSFEEWNNQLYGQNAVNGGMTDGLTSALINSLGWEMEYCYYYVNVSRMLPVEESVPKSVQIIGQNLSSRALDLWCFIEYGVDVSIDILTGSRV
jgi:hypothetical protein